MQKLTFVVLFSTATITLKAQRSQMQIAHNAVGKLQASIAKKEDSKKQLSIIGEGIKAVEAAQNDKKTKNWPETWAIKAYLSSYVAILDEDAGNSQKYYDLAAAALDKAKSLDKYEDNSGLIKSSYHNINIKKQSLGNTQFKNNEFEEAFKNLKAVSDYLPTDTSLAVNVALCAEHTKNYDEALTYFKRAKENGIKNPFMYQQMAAIYNGKFEKDAAIKILEDGLALNPYHPALTNDYINLLLDAEKYDKATKAIETSLTADKKNKLLYYLYGYMQQQQFDNVATAELAYERALDLDQNYFQALYQLALVYLDNANKSLKAGDTQKFTSFVNRAEFTLLKAHEIDRNDRNTMQLLIEIYSRKNKLDRVQEFKRKLNEF